jgi:hypothetical protein
MCRPGFRHETHASGGKFHAGSMSFTGYPVKLTDDPHFRNFEKSFGRFSAAAAFS